MPVYLSRHSRIVLGEGRGLVNDSHPVSAFNFVGDWLRDRGYAMVVGQCLLPPVLYFVISPVLCDPGAHGTPVVLRSPVRIEARDHYVGRKNFLDWQHGKVFSEAHHKRLTIRIDYGSSVEKISPMTQWRRQRFSQFDDREATVVK